jgi:hypothetical protein
VREIRTLRAMWRGLETTHGSDTEALSTETESKQSRPNLRSIGASPRPYRAPKPAGQKGEKRRKNESERKALKLLIINHIQIYGMHR